MRGVRREARGPGLGVLGELVQLHHRGHQRRAALDHVVDQVRAQAGAVLDAVDARLDEPGQHGLAEAVGGDPGAVLVRSSDRVGEGVGGERRREVPVLAGDPVADELDPAVAVAGLPRGRRGQLERLDLVGVVADVALGPGQVSPAPDQPRQVVAVVHPPGVGGRAGVADQQRPGVAVLDGLGLRLLVADRAVVVEPDVAVRVHQTRDDPSLGGRLRAGLVLERDPPVDDIEVADLAVGEHRPTEPRHGVAIDRPNHPPSHERDVIAPQPRAPG